MIDELETALGAGIPAGHPPKLDGDVNYLVDDVAVGRMLFAARPDGTVLATRFVPDVEAEDAALIRLARAVSPRVVRAAGPVDAVRRELEEYLAGRRQRFDVRTDLTLATPFQRTVLAALARIGYGRTTSYAAVAAAAGRPTASRAVGAALGANPLCVVLPCHRVLASGGALTGYAGGLPAKRLLLDLEAGRLGA